MVTSITIRNVPEEVRDKLASRAALAGRSLQEHLLAELADLAARPSTHALLERIRRRKGKVRSRLSTDRILAHRDEDRK